MPNLYFSIFIDISLFGFWFLGTLTEFTLTKWDHLFWKWMNFFMEYALVHQTSAVLNNEQTDMLSDY